MISILSQPLLLEAGLLLLLVSQIFYSFIALQVAASVPSKWTWLPSYWWLFPLAYGQFIFWPYRRETGCCNSKRSDWRNYYYDVFELASPELVYHLTARRIASTINFISGSVGSVLLLICTIGFCVLRFHYLVTVLIIVAHCGDSMNETEHGQSINQFAWDDSVDFALSNQVYSCANWNARVGKSVSDTYSPADRIYILYSKCFPCNRI